MDPTTAITTFGGLTTSALSSFAAVLAWKSKLRFADEFKEARDAEVKAAEQLVKAIDAKKEAEVEKIRLEISKKEIEIEKLRNIIENLERETPKALGERFEQLRSAYEGMMTEISLSTSKNGNHHENESALQKRDVFENQLTALGNELKWFEKIGHERIDSRKQAKKWLDHNREKLAKSSFNYTRAKYSGLEHLCELEAPDYGLKQFYWDIQDYLEILGHCLVVDNQDLITDKPPNFSIPEPYKIAFGFVRRQIPEDLSFSASEEVKKKVDYLISYFDRCFHQKSTSV
jgi:hypothetical protein